MEISIMAKAIISNRIYLDSPGVEATKTIIKALTYKIQKDTGSKKFAAVETIKNYKVLAKGILSIPQGRQDLIPEDYEIIDKRTLVPVPFPKPKFPLRSEQQVVYDEVDDTVFINALVGWGKTFTALHLAHKFGQKTLVITHTASLRDQWAEEVEALFGIKPGIIGGGELDYEDHFITIANVQTLVKHTTTLAKEFGCVILDEAHHCPATTFAAIIDSFYARYRVALSGTMVRKDQKHVVFKDYFGSHVVKPPQSNTLTPQVKLIKPGITLKPGATWVEKINELTQDDSYRRFIAATALTQMAKGHSVLVIADRVEFLEKVSEYVGDESVLVVGGSETEERKRAKEQLLDGTKKCVCGSRQIFSEGISVNILSCVILAVPMSNDSLLEQIVGRVQRLHENKLTPLVIDIQFSGFADKKQNNDRLGLYMRKGWEIIHV
jgi:superfamily II DNA or RNA helicase